MTFKTENIDHLVKQISDLLPEDLRQTRADLEKNIKSALTATLQKMDLVTREEFDIQQELLANSRRLLDELESRIEVLENELKQGKYQD
ncbi:MAG: accessory factor UbiK family protein [Gammaproteobacteria bacterium]|nr:accessory factor UbiK family protein [Gammaproteobacteria bacterium]